MSSIAEVLLAQGFTVSGSDIANTVTTRRLEAKGATVFQGHQSQNLDANVSLVVFSAAIDESNVELVEARKRGIPAVTRAMVLAELLRLKHGIAIAGSHGKTTTTSFIGVILEAAGLDPTVIVGGELLAQSSGARVGTGQYLVAEADESDGSFLLYRPSLTVITNIDDEHLSAYETSSAIDEAFLQFAQSVPFYGLVILCIDNPRASRLLPKISRRVMTYGWSEDATVRGSNIRHSPGRVAFDVQVGNSPLEPITLAMPGEHLAQNALAAIGVAVELGIDMSTIRRALADFRGVGRRLETLGVINGIRVISDYGHHPTEIMATLSAIRASWGNELGRLLVVFQPHRYSRTRDCAQQFINSFISADIVWITDIYAAGETPLTGVSGASLCSSIQHKDARHVTSAEDAFGAILGIAQPNDIVLFLGAGSIASSGMVFTKKLENSVSLVA